ncbi:anaerobic glycerol-3-phosphate dehydrogenase subunit GlpA [Anaeroselena agilis]|uniref:Anaerobic glycerol-3-phosphate dehydrogenase subunit GlpA n=1 Tax=Anaeroselena agilis TaxID=3063788 RepID=A0ABU3P0A7_9FIRM|nr:anaerobic glycerol-3-phosphate dehydrogenase subunit GlpA [Selenomonadales bacterium 4137-cl]
MTKTQAVIIGGGATGAGILRDLAMRGVKAVLVERRDLAYGTSSRFHGLLHSGGRYVVKDPESASECIAENRILRKIAHQCVEDTEGFFVRLPEDDPAFEQQWLAACRALGLPAAPLAPAEAVRLEPNLTPRIAAAYRVPDAAVDGFRLCWHNAAAAARHGGEVLTYTEAVGIVTDAGKVTGVAVRDLLSGETRTIACDLVINAAGSWVDKVAALAGAEVRVKPDRGTLIAFNHRFASRVINRLRPPADGDIFVPHGSVTILGTTSAAADRPDDTAPRSDEVLKLLRIGEALFENLADYRILRAFAGTRPLYSAAPGAEGRAASRAFAVIDHRAEGVDGLITVVGGKLTTYRLMAEKAADLACERLGVSVPCRTADEPLVADPAPGLLAAAKKHFPAGGAELAAARLGDAFGAVVRRLEDNPADRALICECELVTLGEIKEIAALPTTHGLGDLRRRTRLGMGTCQGAFCGLRGIGALCAAGFADQSADKLLRDFIEERWAGIRPVLWGKQLREQELLRGIYGASLNIDGAMHDEGI